MLASALDALVIEVVGRDILRGPFLRRLIDQYNEQQAQGAPGYAKERRLIEREQARLGRELANLAGFIAAGNYSPTISSAIAEKERQQAAGDARLRALAAQEAAARPIAMTEEQLGVLIDELQRGLHSEHREVVWAIVRACVQRVTLDGKTVKVEPRYPGGFQGDMVRFCEYPQPGMKESVTFEVEAPQMRGRRPGPLPPTEYQQAVAELRRSGMRLRAIGERYGVTAQAVWETWKRAKRG